MLNQNIVLFCLIFTILLTKYSYSINTCNVTDKDALDTTINAFQCNINVNIGTQVYYWQLHVSSFKRRTIFGSSDKHIHLLIRILLSNQVESNPGPHSLDDSSYPCSICTRECTWDTDAIVCDNCDKWCHIGCVNITKSMYEKYGNTSALWICPICDTPNHSRTIFQSFLSLDNSMFNTNSYSPLSDSSAFSISFNNDNISIGEPVASSSPKPKPPNKPKVSQKKTFSRQTTLRVLTINFRSCKNKVPQIENLITSSKPDIIIGNETWLNKNILSSEIFPSDIFEDVFRRDRTGKEGGGVLIAIRKGIICQEIYKSENVEMIAGQINITENKSLIIVSAYRPPSKTDRDYMAQMIKEITELKLKYKNDTFWLSGDFNLPDIKWPEQIITSTMYPKEINEMFIDMLNTLGIDQLVDFSTRKDNLLDLFCTNQPTLISKIKPIPGLGDHDIILVDAICHPKRSKQTKHKIYLWKKVDLPKVKEITKDFISKITFELNLNPSINECWIKFRDGINKIIDDNIPSKMTKTRYTNPWANTEINKLCKKQRRAYNKAKKTGKKEHKDKYRKIKATAQREIRRAQSKYMENIISPQLEERPKSFWQYIKSKKTETCGVSPLRGNDGLLYSESHTQAEILNKQFKSAFTAEDTTSMPNKGPSPYPTMPDITINNNGLIKILKSLNTHKATGPDNIPAYFLNNLSEEISPFLTKFFQKSINNGEIPNDWKQANVVPIFKKGDKHNAINYRPVSLTAICCKILEHILTSNIRKHLDNNKILTDSQHGFRSKRSCETQLIISIQEIAKSLSTGNQIDIVLLDFSKAFDKVPHKRLVHKLHYYGIRNNNLKWISDFLNNRQQQVLLNGITSSKLSVDSGVPQGTVLGPTLFLLFINDLPEIVKCNSRLFADDCLLFKNVNNKNDASELQKDLSNLEKWEKDWQMKFNPEKCYVINISKKKNPLKTNYLLHNHVLESVDSSKYLGVTISKDLDWGPHINNITSKANKTIGFLRRNMRNCTRKVKNTTYTSLVRPIIEYSSPVWDPYKNNQIAQIEQVQRKAARYVFNDYRSRTPGAVTNMIQNLEWESLESRRTKCRLIFFYKIKNNLVEVPNMLNQSDRRTRGAHKIRQISSSKDFYKFSFFPATITDWNRLPEQVALSPDLESFKSGISTLTFEGRFTLP